MIWIFLSIVGLFICLILIDVYRTSKSSFQVNRDELNNRRVVITGASRGIGEELAYEYARYGCRLILAARNIQHLKNVIEKNCLALGATEVHSIEFDASSEHHCQTLIEQTIQLYQGIDILVLNHTASVYRHFFEENTSTNIQQMKDSFQTNFFGYFHLSESQVFSEDLKFVEICFSDECSSRISAQWKQRSFLSNHCCFIISWNISITENNDLWYSIFALSLLLSESSLCLGTTKHAIQGFFSNLSREIAEHKEFRDRLGVTIAVLGLIQTENAMKQTNSKIHFLAANVRRTVQAIIYSAIKQKKILYYPFYFRFTPVIFHIFSPVIEYLSRLGN